MARNPVDAEFATIAGYWLGIIGSAVGVIGIGFSIYSWYSDSPSLLIIAGSGWVAALLVGLTAWLMLVRLLRYVKTREDELRKANEGWTSLKSEHERLLSIS